MTVAEPPIRRSPPPAPEEFDQRVVFHNLRWETYESLLAARGERHVFLTYDRGVLEIMALSAKHEAHRESLAQMVRWLTKELRLPVKCFGSTTFRRADLQRGLEPDKCFWIAHAAQVKPETYDPARDPPPDLVLEIDITASSIDRMEL